MRRRTRSGSSLALLVCVLLAGGANAADADAVKQARQHFDRGGELYRSARYEDAIREFEAAYAAKPHPVIFYNLGQCYEKLGQHPEAIANYRRYLTELPDASDRDRVLVVIHNLEERAKRDTLQALTIQSAPGGAEVRIDGVKRGATPFQAEVRAGTYAIEVALEGHRDAKRAVTTSYERPTVVDVILEPLQPGEVSTAAPGAPSSPSFLTRKRLWTWVALGAGAVAAGTGAGFGLAANADAARYSNTFHLTREEADVPYNAARLKARTANVLYGVGGLLGAAGVTLFFFEGSF